MSGMKAEDITKIAGRLNAGEIGVLPTDTVYGLVGRALDEDVVEKIYAVKGRPPKKPFIILASRVSQLAEFGISLTDKQVSALSQLWPGPISVIFECHDDRFGYLHRGLDTLAIRLPDLQWLRSLIDETGPLIATSAN
jgi:L-threonylcarbamoyladenylate synthase